MLSADVIQTREEVNSTNVRGWRRKITSEQQSTFLPPAAELANTINLKTINLSKMAIAWLAPGLQRRGEQMNGSHSGM